MSAEKKEIHLKTILTSNHHTDKTKTSCPLKSVRFQDSNLTQEYVYDRPVVEDVDSHKPTYLLVANRPTPLVQKLLTMPYQNRNPLVMRVFGPNSILKVQHICLLQMTHGSQANKIFYPRTMHDHFNATNSEYNFKSTPRYVSSYHRIMHTPCTNVFF
jgi:hypothetical protein